MFDRMKKSLLFATIACTVAMPALASATSLQKLKSHVISTKQRAAPLVVEYRSKSLMLETRLRSAFLTRLSENSSTLVNQDAEGVRKDLQEHFDAVCELLGKNSAQSLKIAVARLEKNDDTHWTDTERRMQHRKLSDEREKNIARLRAYRDRGMFPLNEGHAENPVPIFVDRHDTACAVGHLMRCSGWHREVEFVAATDLLVYVPDVTDGPLPDWVLTSGLTQEEAALIQPAYDPPISTTPMSELSGTGASVSADAVWFDGTTGRISPNGIVYENFQWGELVRQQPFPGSSFAPRDWKFQTPNSALTAPSPQRFGTRTDRNRVFERDLYHAYAPGWRYANILTLSPDEDSFSVVSNSGDTRHFLMIFDLVSPDPSLAIDRVGVWFGAGFNAGQIKAETLVVAPSTFVHATEPSLVEEAPELLSISAAPLGSLSAVAPFFNEETPYEGLQDSVIIEPLNRVTVHTLVSVGSEGYFGNGSHLGGLSHTVRLVAIPEPTSIAVVTVYLLCCVGLKRCRYRLV